MKPGMFLDIFFVFVRMKDMIQSMHYLKGPWKRKSLVEVGIQNQCFRCKRLDEKCLSQLLLKINAKVILPLMIESIYFSFFLFCLSWHILVHYSLAVWIIIYLLKLQEQSLWYQRFLRWFLDWMSHIVHSLTCPPLLQLVLFSFFFITSSDAITGQEKKKGETVRMN